MSRIFLNFFKKYYSVITIKNHYIFCIFICFISFARSTMFSGIISGRSWWSLSFSSKSCVFMELLIIITTSLSKPDTLSGLSSPPQRWKPRLGAKRLGKRVSAYSSKSLVRPQQKYTPQGLACSASRLFFTYLFTLLSIFSNRTADFKYDESLTRQQSRAYGLI